MWNTSFFILGHLFGRSSQYQRQKFLSRGSVLCTACNMVELVTQSRCCAWIKPHELLAMISVHCDGRDSVLQCGFLSVCRIGTSVHPWHVWPAAGLILQPQLLAGGTPQQGWDTRENVACSLCVHRTTDGGRTSVVAVWMQKFSVSQFLVLLSLVMCDLQCGKLPLK